MALQELKVNKLRTFLSLFGVTIGIFCIIGVLSLVNSLQASIKGNLDAFGSNMISVTKWEWLNSSDYPWWKFVNRPQVKYREYEFLKKYAKDAETMYYANNTQTNVLYKDNTYNAIVYCTSDEMNQAQDIRLQSGRLISPSEYTRGTPVCIIGYDAATQLFGNADICVGKQITINNTKVTIIGLVKKQGNVPSIFFQYDYGVILPYHFFATIYNADNLNPLVFVKGRPEIANEQLIDELRGLMRQIRRLSPTQDDNFALNDIDLLRNQFYSLLNVLNIAGWAIAGLSLLVGGFGIANIMFVSVRERRSQIGLKKAIGAKNFTILSEFLIESAFLCVLGGIIGLVMVWLLAMGLSAILPFPIFIAGKIVLLAFSICIALGVIAGILPASAAARLNPVVAIRSN